MAKTTIWIRSEGVNYYLSGGGPGQTVYAGSGTPWTTESATPYELALANVPSYVPMTAPGALVMSNGGAMQWGASIVAVGYDSVTEQIGVQCKATTTDNAIFLVRQLQQILATGQRSYAPTLAIQGGTNAAYFEILWADVQLAPETPLLPAGTLLVTLTLVRQPHGMPASLTTLLNGVTFTNNDTAISLGALAGDLLNEGQPLRVVMTGGQLSDSTAGQRRIYAATVAGAPGVNTGSIALSSSSTSPATNGIGSLGIPTFSAGTHLRALARITSPTANLEVRALWTVNQQPLAVGPWVRATGTQTQLIDLGPFRMPVGMQTFQAAAIGTPLVGWLLQYRSGDGAAASGTSTRGVLLEVYTFGMLQTESGSTLAPTALQTWVIAETAVRDGAARMHQPPITGLIETTSGPLIAPRVLRGTPPRAFSGASLWLNWQRLSTGHSTSNTVTVTVEHAPLYRHLRGGG